MQCERVCMHVCSWPCSPGVDIMVDINHLSKHRGTRGWGVCVGHRQGAERQMYTSTGGVPYM